MGIDLEKALAWFRRAAEQGHSGAQYNLAVMCAFGRGTPKNETEAIRWYREAAERGEPLAQFNIGQRYDLGKGVPHDPAEAYKWLRLAETNGIPDSAKFLKEVRSKMNREQITQAERRVAEFVPKKGS